MVRTCRGFAPCRIHNAVLRRRPRGRVRRRPRPAAPPTRPRRPRRRTRARSRWGSPRRSCPARRPSCCPTAPPPPRPTRRRRCRTRSGPPTRSRTRRTATAAATAPSSRAAATTAPAPSPSRCTAAGLLEAPAGLRQLHALGREGPGHVDHGLHEPRSRLRGDRRAAARHELRRRRWRQGPRWRAKGRPRRATSPPPARLLTSLGRGQGRGARLAGGAPRVSATISSRSARRLRRRVCASRSRRCLVRRSRPAAAAPRAGGPSSSTATIVR